MTRLIPKTNQPEQDVVYTPRTLSKSIINFYKPEGFVLDPCLGDGSFYDQYETRDKDWCEISKGRDFFQYTKQVDWIITNPPWSIFRQFLEHSLRVSDNVVFLAPITHFVTKARIKLISNSGFGIKTILCVPTPPKPWPQSGFQLAAVHIQKGYDGPIEFKNNNE